jgi:polyhydroxyalkanoate synthesis regulator protein
MNQSEPLPILIKIYSDRRFYDGEVGRYRSLDELRVWKERRAFRLRSSTPRPAMT